MIHSVSAWLMRQRDVLLPLLLLLPVLWALLPGGLPNSADGMVHFARIIEIISSWRDGILIPRWSLNLGFGYGIPVFIFGPPLAYWLGAAYHLLGFGPETAYKMMLVTILVIGAVGTYRLGQVLLGLWAGVVAVAAYIYAPNQLFTLFVQGNAPQLLAWSFLPWALWATIQIYRAGDQRTQLLYAGALALAVSLTLISHNVVALILVPTVAGLALALWIPTRNRRALFVTAGAGALGGMMSAWFAIPALLETVYASTDAIVASDYRTRFVPLHELLAWPARLDAAAINPYIPRTLGLPQIIAALAGVALLVGWAITRRDHPVKAHARIFWGTASFMALYALFCGLMTTAWSLPIWERLPLLDFFQFPARWIGFALFGLAWLAAAAVGLVRARHQPFLGVILCLFLITPALVYLYPDKTPPGTRTISTYEVVDYEVDSGAIGTTSYGEFNPRWAPRPLPPSPMLEDYMMQRPVDRLKGRLPEGASHRILKVTAHRQLYEITLPAPATISINLLYFPGWRATVNRTPVDIWPQAESGLITLELPAGENTLDLTFGPTPLRRAMGMLSTAAWIVFGVAWLLLSVRRASAPSLHPLPLNQAGRAIGMTSAAMAVILLLQALGTSWFQLRSSPDQALAAPVQRHDDVGERFRLLGQSPIPTTVRAGATLSVVTYWRALVEIDEDYAVVLWLEDVSSGQTLVMAEQSHPNDIPTSGWATGLYVRNTWQLAIPADALPVQYALRTGFRDPATGELLPTKQGTSLELGRLWVQPQKQPAVSGGPSARFGPSIELLGAATDQEALTLYWRANAPITEGYSIFVHLLDANGKVVGQMDGLPFANRYQTWAWQPGQIIEDRRAPREWLETTIDSAQIHAVAVGIYRPTTGERLGAVNDEGKQLPNNAMIIPWQ